MTFDTKGRRPIEYRDRDILSAIGLECQLCIGLKKTHNTSMCHVHAFIQTLKTVDIFWRTFQRDQSFWSCFRYMYSTDILVGENIFLQFSIKILTYKFNINRSYMDSTYNFWNAHKTDFRMSKYININNAQNYYSNLPLIFVMFRTNIHLISFLKPAWIQS